MRHKLQESAPIPGEEGDEADGLDLKIIGADGKVLPKSTRHTSGVRAKVRDGQYSRTDVNTERPGVADDGSRVSLPSMRVPADLESVHDLEPDWEELLNSRLKDTIVPPPEDAEDGDLDSQTLVGRAVVLPEADPNTLPPVSVMTASVRYMSERAIARGELEGEDSGVEEPGRREFPTTPLLIDTRRRLDMDVYRKNIQLLETNHKGILIKWWVSRMAEIRLWGQLNCALQVFDDHSIAADIKAVFGTAEGVPGVAPRETDNISGVRFTPGANTEFLKGMMKQKYPASFLNSIVKDSVVEEPA